MSQQQTSEFSYDIYIGKVDNYIIETISTATDYEYTEDGVLEFTDSDGHLVFWVPASNVLYMRLNDE